MEINLFLYSPLHDFLPLQKASSKDNGLVDFEEGGGQDKWYFGYVFRPCVAGVSTGCF